MENPVVSEEHPVVESRDDVLQLDGTEELASVVELQKLLERLEAKAGSIMDSLAQVLQSHHPGFRGTFENISDVQNTIAGIDSNVQELISRMASPTSTLGAESSASHRRAKLGSKLEDVQRVIRSLEQLNHIKQLFSQMDSSLASERPTQYVVCAGLIDELDRVITSLEKQVLTSAKASNSTESVTIRAIKVQFMRKSAKLRAKLQSAFVQMHDVPKPHTISVKGGRDLDGDSDTERKSPLTISMRELLKAFETLGSLDDKLEKGIASTVVTQIVNPLFESTLAAVRAGETDVNKLPYVTISEPNASNGAVTLSLEITHFDNHQNGFGNGLDQDDKPVISAEIVQHVFDQISSALHFVFRDVLAQDNVLFSKIAPYLWSPSDPQLSGGVAIGLLKLLQLAMPTANGAFMDQCYQVQHSAEEFENNLVELGFLHDQHESLALERYLDLVAGVGSGASQPAADRFFPPSQPDQRVCKKVGKILTPYVRDIEVHWAKARQASILVETRQCISETYVRLVLAHDELKRLPQLTTLDYDLKDGEKSPKLIRFTLPDNLVISVAAARCVALAYTSLDGAVGTKNTGASALLYHCARNVFTMFRSLLRSVHKQSFADQPEAAMLFHNDCTYLVHHLVTLAHQYREHFDPKLRPNIITVDLIPQLRKEGHDHLEQQVQTQLDALVKLFKKGPPLTHIAAEYSLVEEAMNNVVSHFNKITHAWGLVLANERFLESVAALSEGFVEEIMKAFRALPVIHNEEMQHLHFLLNIIAANMFSVDTERSQSGTSKAGKQRIGHMIKNSTQVEVMASILEPQVTPATFVQMNDSGVFSALEPRLLKVFENAVQERADFRA